jgi:hypothetical protein
MSYVDIETQIEQAVETMLNVGGADQAFSVVRFYSTVDEMELIEFIQSKVKAIPCVFFRVTGDVGEELDSTGRLHVSSFSLELILAVNNYGKLKQIKAEPRKVNYIKSLVLNRLAGQTLNIEGQPDCFLSYQGASDLFTSETLDVRQINIQVRGIVQDFT